MSSNQKYNLFEHQKSGIEFLKKTGKAILADEMGLGKTRMAIIAAKQTGRGAVVVCPASLKINWMREIKEVYPNDCIEIVDSSWAGVAPSVPEWLIINYDILEKKLGIIEESIERKFFDTLILDEAHYIKGKSIRAACIVGGMVKQSGRTVKQVQKEAIEQGHCHCNVGMKCPCSAFTVEKKCPCYEALKPNGKKKITGIAEKMRQVYLLTGTPLLNRPIELFNLLRAISHPLGKVRTAFAKKYCGAYLQTIYTRHGILRFVNEQGATNLEQLSYEIKESVLRRKKKEVLNLPEKIVTVMECELTKEWQKTYDTAWDAYLDWLAKNPMPEKNIDNILLARQLVEIQKLKQVCSQAKIARIVSDIRNAVEQGEKVIVFSQYTETIKQLAETLKVGDKLHGPVKNVTLTGADDMHERQKAVDGFQNDEKIKVFIANIKAGGVGINLTAASIVIFADMDWSPEIHNQAEDRAHRIGQKGTVNIYYYICPGTIEDDIIDILNSKKHVMDRILEGGEIEQSAQREFLARLKKKAGDGKAIDKVV
jgi:SWI/SNF-related matrix-associated actin-dependent regulator 1 of chromatin subfamily A